MNNKDETKSKEIGGEQGGEKRGKNSKTGMVESRRREKSVLTSGMGATWLNKSCNKEHEKLIMKRHSGK